MRLRRVHVPMRAHSLTLIVMLFAGNAFAASPEPQEKLNETLATLARTRATQAQLERQQAAIQRELEKLQTHATELAERLQVSERRVSTEEQALSTVSGKLSARQREFEARKADYAATVVTLLRLRRLPVTSIFSSSPEEFRKLMLTAAVLEKTNIALAQKANVLRDDLDALKSLRGETTVRRARTSTETALLMKEQAALEKALRERQALHAKVTTDRARAEEQVAKLSRESQSLQELLGKLEAQAKVTPPPPPQKSRNVATKGNLSAPVAGETIHKFGEPKNAGDTYRGMVIRARSGATVVAPNDGQIVFTGPFRDYGNMLLIKHPGGYISLLAGVGKLNATMGQNVKKGEPVAVMGIQKDPEAYVELRDSSSKPIDPADWFANVSSKMSQR